MDLGEVAKTIILGRKAMIENPWTAQPLLPGTQRIEYRNGLYIFEAHQTPPNQPRQRGWIFITDGRSPVLDMTYSTQTSCRDDLLDDVLRRVLQRSLTQDNPELSFIGPRSFHGSIDGNHDFTYSCELNGDLTGFSAYEEICLDRIEMYRMRTNGALHPRHGHYSEETVKKS
ncbi:hypothetical protein KY362_05900 [Candidatus Woesearchaeota archaeon]|nr:hypothetical protein [Candidatus Woesearchaeota archaeon]